MQIPIIDLFAGPGGLGEGFSALLDEQGRNVFKIGLSIEKEFFAHQTLTLRSFYRQFGKNQVPVEYYKAISGEISVEKLYSLYPAQASNAKEEAWNAALGEVSTDIIDHKISRALKGERDWVLIGGPPCQAYSLVGRSRNQGIDPNDPRVYLYREYYRILAVHNPPVFIMENVKGLLSAKVDKNIIFQQILNDLRNPVEAFELLNGVPENKMSCPGYKIYSLVQEPNGFELDGHPVYQHSDFVIQAEDYGIPQTRHRVILLGIRNDISIQTVPLIKKTVKTPVKDVLTGLPALRSGLSKEKDTFLNWKKNIARFNSKNHKSKIDAAQASVINKVIDSIETGPDLSRGAEFIPTRAEIKFRPKWFLDEKIGGVCNHSTRSHISDDLLRYLFVSSFAEAFGRSPKLSEFPPFLLPNHKNVAESIVTNKFADRFRVQVSDSPAKTITSHISKDGHYYIHPDSIQCRSLTVREAARIQTFPDNYFFLGPRTAQYIQVGNAVPPVLSAMISEVVATVFQQMPETIERVGSTKLLANG